MIQTVIDKLTKILTSVKLALYLIIILTIVSIIGVTRLSRAIFSSWWFLTLVIIFFLNTLFCTIRQYKSTISRLKRYKQGKFSFASSQELMLSSKHKFEDVLENVEQILRQKRYKVKKYNRENGILLFGQKNRLAYWGSVIFHISLLIIIIGGILTLTLKFWGSFGVMEGNVFVDKPQNYVMLREPTWFKSDFGRFKLHLKEVKVDINDKGEIHDYKANIAFVENEQSVKRAMVSGPNPVEYNGLIFYKKLFGYAPGLILKQNGREKVRFFTTIDSTLNKEQIQYKQKFKIPRSSLQIKAKFYPTVDLSDDKPKLKSHALNRPALYLKIFKNDDLLYEGLLAKGETVGFANYSLGFSKLKRWYGFSVVKDYGIPFVFFGSGLAIIGLILIYLVNPREIKCLLRKKDNELILEFDGHSPRFKTLFTEEFENIIEEIENELIEKENR